MQKHQNVVFKAKLAIQERKKFYNRRKLRLFSCVFHTP